MLAFFTVKRNFYKLRATIHVDCEAKEASLTLTYAGRIVRHNVRGDLRFDEVRSPELAEAWLGQLVGPEGSKEELLAFWERYHRERESEYAAREGERGPSLIDA